MIRRPRRSTQSRSSAASDVYKRQQESRGCRWESGHVNHIPRLRCLCNGIGCPRLQEHGRQLAPLPDHHVGISNVYTDSRIPRSLTLDRHVRNGKSLQPVDDRSPVEEHEKTLRPAMPDLVHDWSFPGVRMYEYTSSRYGEPVDHQYNQSNQTHPPQ